MPPARGWWLGLEGTRSYRIGLARVLQAAGLTVVEIERPGRGERRRGKSDPIDAHLAALHALRLDADRLPTPRADGDGEALRILLGAPGTHHSQDSDDQSPTRVAAHRRRRRPSAVPRRADLRPARCPSRAAAAVSTKPANTPSGAPRPAASPSPSAGSSENSPITSGISPTWSPT